MVRMTDAWAASDKITLMLAERSPHATITSVRDIYGRCSFTIENVSGDELTAIETEVLASEEIRTYLGPIGVQSLQPDTSLTRAIHAARKPLGALPNAFVVERLLTNESWIRDSDKNPEQWPPVVAFYSFKGGVGRSVTAATTALTLAREGLRVIVLDLDLEAPGIEGYFFNPDDPSRKVRAGVVDYLLESAALGERYRPDINDFVLPYADPAVASSGGSLLIVPAGRLDGTYMERLGRVNLADIGRKRGPDNPIRALIEGVLAFRTADVVVVDCRTGFTDLGGITLNGLSTLDVLVFRGGEADRRYLPVVLENIHRLREKTDATPQAAEQLARSLLVVYTMVERPPKSDEAERYVAELRRFTGEAMWKHVFERFSKGGYAYPDDKAQDSPLESVPHDVVLIPYLKDFFMVGSVVDMLRLASERPEQPYEALVRRIMDVKLAPPESRAAAPEPLPVGSAPTSERASERDQALSDVKQLTESAAGERELASPDDVRRRFLPRAAYRTLLDPKAFLILGRKGTGKSALFKVLTFTDVALALSRHLGLDARLVERTTWVVGFANEPHFPQRDDFTKLHALAKDDPDRLSNFWRALAAFRLAQHFGRPIPDITSLDDCITKLSDEDAQASIRQWLTELNQTLEKDDRFCCVSHDDLDTGLTSDARKRGLLVSGLVDYWQQSVRRLPRIRAKIFLREDIWNREVLVTDKAKVRDGIDRGTITWDGLDIYRTVIKRLGHSLAFQSLLKEQRLWLPGFDEMLGTPLGFVPPEDEAWLRKCIGLLAGETMGAGAPGHKKGYVYTWVLDHISDAAGLLRPRNALLLFSEAAKLQEHAETTGSLLNPRRFMDALRAGVSRHAVDDLRAEFTKEWSFGEKWLPARFAAFSHIWPVDEKELIAFLQADLSLDRKVVVEKIEQMSDAGLIERREGRGREPQLQIPDIYLFGLDLTRKG
jgi:cellulose biosynthesis protein BcsQ